MKRSMEAVLWGLLLSVCAHAAAQNIYRCGNEYTNHARSAKERDCKLVQGGQVTVVHGAVGGRRAATSSPPVSPAPGGDTAQQRARDSDAKAILQAELNKARADLARLQAEYNDGSPQRSALELRNPQGYLQRVDALQADIARQQNDIASIQRELGRLP